MSAHWELVAGGLIGTAFIVIGVITRVGRYRVGVQRTYLREDPPGYQRNAVFALIPVGVAFVCISAGASLMQAHGTLETGTDPDPLANGLMLIGLVALVTGIWWTVRPPGWAKPAWLRECEGADEQAEPVPHR